MMVRSPSGLTAFSYHRRERARYSEKISRTSIVSRSTRAARSVRRRGVKITQIMYPRSERDRPPPGALSFSHDSFEIQQTSERLERLGMPGDDPIRLNQNGLGAQIYVTREILRESGLDQGDRARPDTLPDGSIVFRPIEEDLDNE